MAVVAIDGVAGSGKSTLARSLARELRWNYLDTGAMFRTLALAALRNNLDWDDPGQMTELAKTINVDIADVPPSEPGVPTTVLLDGEDVSREIREPQASEGSSRVAIHPGVRAELRRQQQVWIAEHPNCVVEGRDIASVVAPQAEVKIYLTAATKERAERRVDQTDGMVDLQQVHEHITWRDEHDLTKGALEQVDDAVVIDTTNLAPEETLKVALGVVRAKS